MHPSQPGTSGGRLVPVLGWAARCGRPEVLLNLLAFPVGRPKDLRGPRARDFFGDTPSLALHPQVAAFGTEREVLNHAKLRHPHIISLHEVLARVVV